MNKRKRTILFSATLATAGLVAGSLVAMSNKTTAAEFSSMSLEDITSVLSRDLNVSASSISESLSTKTLFTKVDDESVLRNDPSIVAYGNIFKNYYIVTYDSARETGIGYKTLSQEDSVKGLAMNYSVKADRVNPGSGNESWGVHFMRLDSYADSLSSSTELDVAVLDSGVNPAHVMFTEQTSQDRINATYGANFVNVSPDSEGYVQCTGTNQYQDDHFHGTAVAGLITASTPRNVKIVPVKVLSSSGSGSFYASLCGVLHAADHAKVLNMSLGMEQKDLDQDTKDYLDGFYQDVVDEKKVIIVAAAGNESASTIDYPAAAPANIAATSINSSNTFSSSYSNHGSAADFATPGESMSVAYYTTTNGFVSGASGTSFSSPLLAAAVADILVEHPSYSKDDVLKMLKLNAEDLGQAGWDEYYGYGSVTFRINKFADVNISLADPTDWAGPGQNAVVRASVSSSSANITHRAVVSGSVTDVAPTSWQAVSNPGKSISDNIEFSQKGTYTVWYKNANNEYKAKVITVNKFDTTKPSIAEALKVANSDYTSAQLSIKVQDTESGLDKIDWMYKSESGSWQTKTDNYAGAETGAVVRTYTLTGLSAGTYSAYAKVYDNVGNVTTTSTINFTIESEPDGVTIANVSSSPESWTKGNVTMTVVVDTQNSNITDRAVMEGANVSPKSSSWTSITTSGNRVTDTFKVSKNGDYTVWYRNASNNLGYAVFTVSNIDKTAPTISKALSASATANDAVKLSIGLTDDLSGFSKVQWFYKVSTSSSYQNVTDNYSGSELSATLTHDLQGLAAGEYQAYAKITDKAGNETTSSTISFTITEPEPDGVTIANVSSSPDTWTKGDVTMTIVVDTQSSNITHRAVMEGSNTSPADSSWTAITTTGNRVTDTFKISKNGDYTVWYKNAGGYLGHVVFTVGNIDKTAPTISKALSASAIADNAIKLSVGLTDDLSGFSKVQWFYKAAADSTYQEATDNYTGNELSVTLTHNLEDLAIGEYQAYAKITDKAGNVATTDTITFEVEDTPVIEDKLTINSVNVPTTWSNTNVKVTVKASSTQTNIVKRAVVKGQTTEPTEDQWEDVANPGKSITDTITITENGSYTVWYMNETGSVAPKQFTVNKIDKAKPTIDTALAASEITKNSAKLTVSTSDTSGIAKIQWYYKLNDGEYEVEVDVISESVGLVYTLGTQYTHKLENLEVGYYTAYARITDNAGNFVDTPEVTFTVEGDDDPVDPTDPTEPVTPDEPANPSTFDGIGIISTIGGAILAAGVALVAKLRRIR